MDKKFEYNFSAHKIPRNTLPEKIKPDTNEYLFPLREDIWNLIIESLEDSKNKTSSVEKKELIHEFNTSIEKLGTENLLGKIAGYYVITDYKNSKWKESKKIKLEIKII